MKKLINFLLTVSLFLTQGFVLPVQAAEEPLKVVSSFTIITHLVEDIGGEHVEVHNLVPTGTDPHEYEPLPNDIKAATDADIAIYNGLNLEGSEEGWFMKLMRAVDQPEDMIFEAASEVEPRYLDEAETEMNPHAFLDPNVGILMAEKIIAILSEVDPDNQADYEANGEKVLEELRDIEQQYADTFAAIPEEDRVFFKSEFAFQYMSDRYGLKEGYIWAIDTEENGSPDQIREAIKFIEEHQPKYLFVESNVDRRPIETVSKETGVEIYPEVIYADEVGTHEGQEDTYIEMLRINLDVISRGLKGE